MIEMDNRHDDHPDIAGTDTDAVTVQDEQDVIFGVTPPSGPLDVPDDEGDDDGA